MALLNLVLVVALVVAQDFAAGRYLLFSVPGGLLIALPFAVGCSLHGLSLGLAFPIAGRDLQTRRRVASHLSHTVVAVLTLLYFVEPLKGLPALLSHLAGSPLIAWGACAVAVAGLGLFLSWLPVRFTGLVFAASLSMALVVAIGEAAVNRSSSEARVSAKDLPNVYYIVLDAQASPGAFPAFSPGAIALRDRMRADYAGAAFEIHDRAHTNYYWTDRSLYSILDNQLHDVAPRMRAGAIQMPPNALFEAFLSQGYRARIHQSSYLDLCGAAASFAPTCHTYPAHNLASNSPSLQEMWLVLTGLMSRLVHHPDWTERRRIFSATNSVSAFDSLIADVATHPRGQFVFAHFLIPHEPFVLDEHCNLRRDAVQRFQPIGQHAGIGVERAKTRWRDYGRQVECTHGRVMQLVAALRDAGVYDEATVIVQGDHGSRISAARWDRGSSISGRLFLDFYAPLFAVKRGDYPLAQGSPDAGREHWASVSVVLAELMGWQPPEGSELLRRNDPRKRYQPRLNEADAIMANSKRAGRTRPE